MSVPEVEPTVIITGVVGDVHPTSGSMSWAYVGTFATGTASYDHAARTDCPATVGRESSRRRGASSAGEGARILPCRGATHREPQQKVRVFERRGYHGEHLRPQVPCNGGCTRGGQRSHTVWGDTVCATGAPRARSGSASYVTARFEQHRSAPEKGQT